ncbi:MAG: Fe-S-containing protein [Clostridiales bacterium]|nr:Fe-S-containing protein [Clostridiales bacterium]
MTALALAFLVLPGCAPNQPGADTNADISANTNADTFVDTNVDTSADTNVSANSGDGEDLVIPIKDIAEKATFYPMKIDGVQLEVFAVKASDGTVRTAFNTCQVCYDSGRGYYQQEGNAFVCQNCGNRFKTDQIEVVKGGCNPWPIMPENKTVTEETITIPYDFLKEATVIFGNWKVEY